MLVLSKAGCKSTRLAGQPGKWCRLGSERQKSRAACGTQVGRAVGSAGVGSNRRGHLAICGAPRGAQAKAVWEVRVEGKHWKPAESPGGKALGESGCAATAVELRLVVAAILSSAEHDDENGRGRSDRAFWRAAGYPSPPESIFSVLREPHGGPAAPPQTRPLLWRDVPARQGGRLRGLCAPATLRLT